MTDPLLEVRSLSLTVRTPDGHLPVLRAVDLTIGRGQIVGLVGESGSGKSMTARCVIRSLPPGSQVGGTVRLAGEDLLQLSPSRLRELRSREIGVIFQDPRSGVDPLFPVEDHLTEGLRVHDGLSRAAARDRAIELLSRVGIRDGARRLRQYPDELSGGLLQRVVIAGALAGDPDLLIADEPTTALDVTTQAEIVAIFAGLRRERQLAMLFITHDLALAASLCDRILVMYAGRVLEDQRQDGILRTPAHPYTAALVGARPNVERRAARLTVIPGNPVSASEAPSGCPFRTRCPYAEPRCAEIEPSLQLVGDALTACIRVEEIRTDLHV
jgi:oligopeptide/dipeptide ABC transporter ATP-binding protein